MSKKQRVPGLPDDLIVEILCPVPVQERLKVVAHPQEVSADTVWLLLLRT
jgi:hypothetical protein